MNTIVDMSLKKQHDEMPPHAADADVMPPEVLSRRGDFAASEDEQKFVCLLSNGQLLIAEGHGMNAHVLSYRARLEHMRRLYRPVFVPIQSISRMYQSGNADRGTVSDHTRMQITAKDLLSKACHDRASDIHIRVTKFATEIHFRIHNDLLPVGSQTREYGERLLATLYGAMTTVSDNSYKPTERQDASIGDRDKLPDRLYGVRIATAPTSEGNLMVLRLLYNDAGDDVDLRPLGFSDSQADAIQLLKEQPIGMNVISGPTGSGKSTTLQRILCGEIRESGGRIHVITVEDPIEYPIEGAVQTPVTNAGTEEERSRAFSAAISNAMRLDPDTIMIGEIRDKASAQSALRSAMTGHQVWTTVHANSALGIVDRLVDLGMPVSMVADPGVVTGLISQRLVKVLCPSCKRSLKEHDEDLPEALTVRLRQALGAGYQSRVCVAGAGCSHCHGRGTSGRSVLAEVVIPDERLFAYVRAGDKAGAHRHWMEALGGRAIVEHAIEKVAAGIVDPRMAEKVVGRLVAPMRMVSGGNGNDF
jgi:type II secretory ATPase GspE/PulE/Tfp pilus assembly ATPase PilB-like protein